MVFNLKKINLAHFYLNRDVASIQLDPRTLASHFNANGLLILKYQNGCNLIEVTL